MGIISRGGAKSERLDQIQINESSQGKPVAVVMGQQRVHQTILWTNGLVSWKSDQAGKGGGKGGSQFIYASDLIAGLCNGPVTGVADVWDGQSWLSSAWGNNSFTLSISGIYAPDNAALLVADNGVVFEATYSATYTDYGAPAATVLSGTDNVPLQKVPYGTVLTSGQYSVNPASIGTFVVTSVDTHSGGNTVYHGTFTGGASPYTSGASNAYIDFAFLIAGFAGPTNNGTFKCVASTATSVTLNNAAGSSETRAATAKEVGNSYHFYTGDAGKTAVVSYQYTIQDMMQQEVSLIPSSGTVTVGGIYNPTKDMGVWYYNIDGGSGPQTLVRMTNVGSATPSAAGQYKVTWPGTGSTGGADYHFYVGTGGDLNQEVLLQWQFQNLSAAQANNPNLLKFELHGGGIGQAIWSFILTGGRTLIGNQDGGQAPNEPAFPDEALGYSGTSYLGYGPMALGASGAPANINAEVTTPWSYGGRYTTGPDTGNPIVDCNPVTCIVQVLTNRTWGLGGGPVPFPISAIDLIGDGATLGTGGPGSVSYLPVPSVEEFPIWFLQGDAGAHPRPYDGSDVSAHPGNIVTVYYNDIHERPGPDLNLINAFKSAAGAYVFLSGTGLPAAWQGLQTVTAYGADKPYHDTEDTHNWFQFICGGPPAGIFASYAGGQYVQALIVPGTGGSRGADSTAWSYFAANGFFISPFIDSQESASSIIGKWLEAGNVGAYYSEGLIKLVPYGTQSAAGNGCTWIAPSSAVVALDDDCFIKKGGEDPVKVSRSNPYDGHNKVQISWKNRMFQYETELTQEPDQAAINRWGERLETAQTYDFICTLGAATFAANMRVKRLVNNRREFVFELPFAYSYAEPMDLVEITTSSVWAAGLNNANLGIVNLPVRIKKIVDRPDGTLEVTCEDSLFAAGLPVLFNKQTAAGNAMKNAYLPPGGSEVVMFEAPAHLTNFGLPEIWIGAVGSTDQWGSTNIWASQDGTKYQQIGTIEQAARLGELDSTFASGSDPDTTNSLVLDLAENCAALEAGTSTDADSENTLLFVDGEIVAYSAAEVTGPNQQTLNGYIRRGLRGSSIGSHAAGSLFVRLDSAIFKYAYNQQLAGQVVYFKFQSVNTFDNMAQDLSTLTPVAFTIPGQNGGTVDASSGLVIIAGPNRTPLPPGSPRLRVMGWGPVA